MSDPNLGKPGGGVGVNCGAPGAPEVDWSEEMAKADPQDGTPLEAVDTRPPPVGATEVGRRSWAAVLGGSLPKRDDKNVLEIVLEKESRGSFMVTESECAHMMGKLGLDSRPGVHVEGVQICPQGRGVIFITLKKEVDPSRFCRHDVLEISESGIRSILVKAAGKREVVVTARGIHPNTREDVVMDYLGKFGKVFTSKVVHCVFSDGPLKGMRNGDRSYKMEVKPGTNLGSYHAIDGHKITLRYPGQQQTCARCHQVPQICKGKGVARRCEAQGGVKIEFHDYILDLWQKIGYSPDNLDLTEIRDSEKVSNQNGGSFTPPKGAIIDTGKFTGVSIKQFPKGTDQGHIVEFLVNCGLPETKTDNISFNSRGTVTIKELENSECLVLIEAIHGKRHFERKLYCNGVTPLTPEKPDLSPEAPLHVSGQPITPSANEKPLPPGQPITPPANGKPLPPGDQTVDQHKSPQSPSMQQKDPAAMKPVKPLPPVLITDVPPPIPVQSGQALTPNWLGFSSGGDLARRHSLSLLDRSPDSKSLAAELLNFSQSVTMRAGKSIFKDIDDISEALSDFNSCNESIAEPSSSSSDESDAQDHTENSENSENGLSNIGFQTANDKKRCKKYKRKLKLTPGKEQFLKKPNNKASPK